MDAEDDDCDPIVLSDMHLFEINSDPTSLLSTRYRFELPCVSSDDLETFADPSGFVQDEDGDVICKRRTSSHQYATFTIQHTGATALSDVGMQLWRGSMLMCDYILTYPELFTGVVFDLGAGLGLTSIVAGMYAARVFSTDYKPEILAMASHNIHLNSHHLTHTHVHTNTHTYTHAHTYTRTHTNVTAHIYDWLQPHFTDPVVACRTHTHSNPNPSLNPNPNPNPSPTLKSNRNPNSDRDPNRNTDPDPNPNPNPSNPNPNPSSANPSPSNPNPNPDPNKLNPNPNPTLKSNPNPNPNPNTDPDPNPNPNPSRANPNPINPNPNPNGGPWTLDDLQVLRGEDMVFLACDVMYDDLLVEALMDKLALLMRPNDVLYVALERRITFSMELLSTVSLGYNTFAKRVGLGLGLGLGLGFSAERVEVSFPQRCFQYARTPQLELWRVTRV